MAVKKKSLSEILNEQDFIWPWYDERDYLGNWQWKSWSILDLWKPVSWSSTIKTKAKDELYKQKIATQKDQVLQLDEKWIVKDTWTNILTDIAPTETWTNESPIETTWWIEFTKDKFIDISTKALDDPNSLTQEEKSFLNRVRVRQSLWESIDQVFWITNWETTTQPEPWQTASDYLKSQQKEAEAELISKQRWLALEDAKKITDRQEKIDFEKRLLKEQTENASRVRKEQLNTQLARAWVTISSWARRARDEIDKDMNDKLELIDQRVKEEMNLFEAEIKWESEEVLNEIRWTIRDLKWKVIEKEIETIEKWLEISKETKMDAKASLDFIFESFSEETKTDLKDQWYNKDLSAQIGYISDWNWKPLLTDVNWNPIPIVTKTDSSWNVVIPKIQEIKDWNWNVFIYKDWELDKVITNQWEIIDWKSISSVPKEVLAEKWNKDTKDFQNNLRKEYDWLQEIKRFRDIQWAYNRINSWLNSRTAAGDLAWIFAFMKMLDPWSVVREGEFANAQNATGVPDVVRNLWNKMLTWERLWEQQRKDFINQAQKIYNDEWNIVNWINEKYIKISNDLWVNSDLVITPLNQFKSWYSLKEQLPDDDISEINSMFWFSTGWNTWTWWTTWWYNTSTWKSFDDSFFDVGFNQAEETAITTPEAVRNTEIAEWYIKEFDQHQATARTNRMNNPTAMTVDVARTLWLVEWVDYVKWDVFPDNASLFSAKLLWNGVGTTIKAIDNAAKNPNMNAFYTLGWLQRRTHTKLSDADWLKMTEKQKVEFIKNMYIKETTNSKENFDIWINKV